MNGLTAQFVWWQGVVEDRDDPLLIGRCRVRILGYHTDDKNDIPTESLPWAYPAMPINTKPNSTPTGPNEGTWVMGFFRDGNDCQEPVMTHVIDSGFTTDNNPDKGFNDPETNTGKPVGKVPLDVGEINTNRLGRGDVKNTWIEQNQRRTEYSTSYKKAGGGKWSEPDTKVDGNYEYSTEFPYNYVEESESGHIFEVDDTPGKERLSKRHRSGSFEEMHSDGSVMTKVAKDNYEVILGEDNIYVSGSVNITSDAHINIKSAKTIRIQSDNQIRFKSGSAITFDAVGGIQFKGAFVSTAPKVPFMHGGGSPMVVPTGIPLMMDNQVGDLATSITDKIAGKIGGTTGAVAGELSGLTGQVFDTTIPFIFPSLPSLFNPLAMSYAHMAQALFKEMFPPLPGIPGGNLNRPVSLGMGSILTMISDLTGVGINLANPIIPFPSLRMIPLLSDYSSISFDQMMQLGSNLDDMKSVIAMGMTLANRAKETASQAAIDLANRYTSTQLTSLLIDTDWEHIQDLINNSTDTSIDDVYNEVNLLASSEGFIITELSGSFEKGEYLVVDYGALLELIIGTVIRYSDVDILYAEKIGLFSHGDVGALFDFADRGEGRIKTTQLLNLIIRGKTSGASAKIVAVSREQGQVINKYKEVINKVSGSSTDIEGMKVTYAEIDAIKDRDDLIAMLIRIFGAGWKAYFNTNLSNEEVDDIISRVGSTAAGGISTLEKLGEEVLKITGDYVVENQSDNNPSSMAINVFGGEQNLWVGELPYGSLIRVFHGEPKDLFKKWLKDVLNDPNRSFEYPVSELSYKIADSGQYIPMIGDLAYEYMIEKNNGEFVINMAHEFQIDFENEVKYFVVSVGSTTDITENSEGQRVTFEYALTEFGSSKTVPIKDVIWYVIAIGNGRDSLVNEWKHANPKQNRKRR